MTQIHGQHLVSGLEHREINGHVRAAARMRLHVGVFGPKQFLGAVDGQLFDRIYMLAPAVPTFLGVTFGVFVGERRSLRFHHGQAGEILAGDELDVFLLPLAFLFDGLVDLRIHRVEPQIRLQSARLKFAQAPFVASAFEGRT